MKFIISQDGTKIINSDLLRAVHIEEGYYDSDHKIVHVEASIRNDSSDAEIITLARFDNGNKESNFSAAKAYMMKLFAELNTDSI